MFEKKELGTNNIAIIDIGSYKIKIANCRFKKDEIDIVSYSEKRQEQNILTNGEIGDLKSICENLKIAFKKVDPNDNIKKIILNSITPDIFLNSNKISIVRENKDLKISKEELFHIIKNIENECIEKGIKIIKSKTGYLKSDLKILSSNINHISIDGVQVKDLIGKTGKNISISITNIFIPNDKYDIIEEIGKILNKEIITILPEEYSISKVFNEENDVVIINIGNTNTFISIKKSDEIIGSTRINIGMNDLFKKIKEKKIIPTEKIIRDIENNFFDEKIIFLETLKDCLIAGLQEILEGKICPSNFFITGGGGKGLFIKDYLQKIDFISNGIKIIKNIEFITPDFSLNESEIDKIGIDNINILSMIFVAYKIFYDEKSLITDMLKEVISEL
nr:hypothetical protein [Candidatus Gracilibacteria bacterium]